MDAQRDSERSNHPTRAVLKEALLMESGDEVLGATKVTGTMSGSRRGKYEDASKS